MKGAVVNTHIFKDGLTSGGVPEIPILNPSKATYNPQAELQFSRLLFFEV
jgi:hypothetical protein